MCLHTFRESRGIEEPSKEKKGKNRRYFSDTGDKSSSSVKSPPPDKTKFDHEGSVLERKDQVSEEKGREQGERRKNKAGVRYIRRY